MGGAHGLLLLELQDANVNVETEKSLETKSVSKKSQSVQESALLSSSIRLTLVVFMSTREAFRKSQHTENELMLCWCCLKTEDVFATTKDARCVFFCAVRV